MTVEISKAASHWKGLVADTKPTTGGVGSTFYEQDTDCIWEFDGNSWNIKTINGGSVVYGSTRNLELSAVGAQTETEFFGFIPIVLAGVVQITPIDGVAIPSIPATCFTVGVPYYIHGSEITLAGSDQVLLFI